MTPIETKMVVPSELDEVIRTREITAGTLAKVELYSAFGEAGKVHLGVVPRGLRFEHETLIDVPYNSPAFIRSIVRAGAITFFEASSSVVDFSSLTETIESLCRILPSPSRQSATDLYMPVPATSETLVQWMLDPMGTRVPPIQLNRKGAPGISSIRSLAGTNVLLGVKTDHQGRGTSIAIQAAPTDIRLLTSPEHWKAVAHPPHDCRIHTLSRPKRTKDGGIMLAVGLTGERCAMLTLTTEGGHYRAKWSEPVKTRHTPIGLMSGQTDVFASFIDTCSGPMLRLTPKAKAAAPDLEYLSA